MTKSLVRAAIVNRLTVMARRSAPVVLALFAFAYVIRGGVLLFGFVNLTAVFLLLALACVGFLLVFDRSRIEYRFFWADAAVMALALALLVNSSTGAGLEKALRFVVLVVAPYFIARLVLTDTCQLRKFHIYGPRSRRLVLALLAFASQVAPEIRRWGTVAAGGIWPGKVDLHQRPIRSSSACS